MSNDTFYTKFAQVRNAAFGYGLLNVSMRVKGDVPFSDYAHYKKFIIGCHRGYGLAQSTVAKLLQENATNKTLSDGERKRRELLLRKVIDTIIFTMLGGATHVIRRITLHDDAPAIDFPVMLKALSVAESMNRENRLGFAALADLSTFVHICDLVRIDRTDAGDAPVEFIELKEGRVNKLIMEKISKYPPTVDSLDHIKGDPEIAENHKGQARRMHKQKIRMAQVDEILRTDAGMDIKYNIPFRTTKTMIEEKSYALRFGELAEEAIKSGVASFTINYCLHFGICYDSDRIERVKKARAAALYGLGESKELAVGRLREYYENIANEVDVAEGAFHLVDFVELNLLSTATHPLFSWGVPKAVIDAIVVDGVSIRCVVDLPALMFVVEKVGLVPFLSTPREAAEARQMFGNGHTVLFGNRMLKISHPKYKLEQTVLGGAFSRFLCNFHTPYGYFLDAERTWQEIYER